MFHTVHCSIIITDNPKKNAQMIYIFSVHCTYMFRSPPRSARTVTQDILNISTIFLTFLIILVNIQHDDWILDDILIYKYILDECTYR
jgi:hypothetical protein